MINLVIVGLGQLGSNLSIEVTKRAYALDMPLSFTLIDGDEVADRNVAAQWFSPKHIGLNKAEAVAREVNEYRHLVDTVPEMLDVSIPPRFPEQSILIDCVDNAATRHGLWMMAITNNIPLMSLGNSEIGTGLVSWTYSTYDTNPFGLNANTPDKIAKLSEPKKNEEKMPPCELTKFRGLALNTVLAGMESLFLFIGKDVCGRIPSDVYASGFLTTWSSRIDGYELIDIGFSEWING